MAPGGHYPEQSPASGQVTPGGVAGGGREERREGGVESAEGRSRREGRVSHVTRNGGGGGGREEPLGQKPHLLVLGEEGRGGRHQCHPGAPRRRRDGVGGKIRLRHPAEGMREHGRQGVTDRIPQLRGGTEER